MTDDTLIRKTPMPKWAAVMMLFMPKKIKEQYRRMAGYVIFKRAQ